MARPGESRVESGLLLIADVSGYTAYLSGVELEHSHDILADLVAVVADSLRGRFDVVEVEGDAVFVHRLGDEPDGREVMTTIERCYLSFAQRRDMIRLGSGCACHACRSLDALDLKFVVHHGHYVCRSVAGADKLVGPDVVVVHRLLKNPVAERCGTRAYVLLTTAATDALGLDAATKGLVPVELAYDEVGRVPASMRDLRPFWGDECATERVRVRPAAAVLRFSTSLPGDPAQVWDLLTDPLKRKAWTFGVTAIEQSDPGGVPGVGSVVHCFHGKRAMVDEFLDWKPGRYLTRRYRGTPMGECVFTWELEAEPSEQPRTTLRVLGTAPTRRGRIRMRIMGIPFRRFLVRSTEQLAVELAKAEESADPLRPTGGTISRPR
jgi:uncharacterized protein YndB with AHSA1/START domain